MLQKVRIKNQKGFTLIELMIVIAIIGILAAIAIPNFISYRNKAYCSAAESDAHSISAALADYFAIPAHTTLPALVAGTNFKWTAGSSTVTLSGPTGAKNTGTVGGVVNAIVITVTDTSGRCPVDYTTTQPDWSGSVFTKTM